MAEDTTGLQNPIFKIMQSQSQQSANQPMGNPQNPMNMNSMNQMGNLQNPMNMNSMNQMGNQNMMNQNMGMGGMNNMSGMNNQNMMNQNMGMGGMNNMNPMMQNMMGQTNMMNNPALMQQMLMMQMNMQNMQMKNMQNQMQNYLNNGSQNIGNQSQSQFKNESQSQSISSSSGGKCVIFRKSGEGQQGAPIMVQCLDSDKVSEVINRYRAKSGDQDPSKKFIFNAKALNASLSVAEAGLTDNANIFVVATRGVKGA